MVRGDGKDRDRVRGGRERETEIKTTETESRHTCLSQTLTQGLVLTRPQPHRDISWYICHFLTRVCVFVPTNLKKKR